MPNTETMRYYDRHFLNIIDNYKHEYNVFVDNRIKASGTRAIAELNELIRVVEQLKKEIRGVRSQMKRDKNEKKEQKHQPNVDVKPVSETPCDVNGCIIIC